MNDRPGAGHQRLVFVDRVVTGGEQDRLQGTVQVSGIANDLEPFAVGEFQVGDQDLVGVPVEHAVRHGDGIGGFYLVTLFSKRHAEADPIQPLVVHHEQSCSWTQNAPLVLVVSKVQDFSQPTGSPPENFPKRTGTPKKPIKTRFLPGSKTPARNLIAITLHYNFSTMCFAKTPVTTFPVGFIGHITHLRPHPYHLRSGQTGISLDLRDIPFCSYPFPVVFLCARFLHYAFPYAQGFAENEKFIRRVR